MLTDSFILSFSNYWNFDLECKRGKQKVAFWAWKVTRTFEKQAPVPQVLLPFFPLLPGRVLSLSTFSKSNAWDFHLIMTRISENIPATSEDLWQFSEDFWTLLKLSEDVPTTFELFWSYFKGKNFCVLWYSWPQIFSGKLNCTFDINHVLKNNSCGFASQAWEVVLDAWDWCLRFADTRLTHEAWELASINA